jgi:hypothetical protein
MKDSVCSWGSFHREGGEEPPRLLLEQSYKKGITAGSVLKNGFVHH